VARAIVPGDFQVSVRFSMALGDFHLSVTISTLSGDFPASAALPILRGDFQVLTAISLVPGAFLVSMAILQRWKRVFCLEFSTRLEVFEMAEVDFAMDQRQYRLLLDEVDEHH
jgi:hypothetical protein